MITTNLLLIAHQKIETQKKYTYFLYSSQYLYWYFFNNITENIGVNNLNYSDFITINSTELGKVLAQRFNKVKVIKFKDIQQNIINISLKNLQKDSDILRIKFLTIREDNESKKKSVIETQKLYYVAKSSEQEYSLFVFTNQRQEELVKNIRNFTINIVKKNNNEFYIFNMIIGYKKSQTTISFMLKDSLLN